MLRRAQRMARSTSVLLVAVLFALAIASSAATAKPKKPAKTHWSAAELAQITATATEKKYSLTKQDIARGQSGRARNEGCCSG